MKLQKIRWSKVYESTEEELTDFLRSRNISAERQTAEAFHNTEQQASDHDMTIWCAEGSLALRTGGTSISMQPGDALHIPANTAFEISAGISGYVCYESKPQAEQ